MPDRSRDRPTSIGAFRGNWRIAAAILLAIAALIELTIALLDLGGLGFALWIGPLRISSSEPSKPLIAGVAAAAAALLLLPRFAEQRAIAVLSPWRRAAALLIIAWTMIPLGMLLVRPDFDSSHDASAHATYIYLFDRALAQGQFPVRWIEQIESGHSQPLFNFYQVGLYYIVEGVHLAVPSLALSLKLAVAMSWCAGAWFTFLWWERRGWWPAVGAAVVFAWSPYLLLDVFVRGAYPELVAVALTPGVLWSLDRYVRTGSRLHLIAVPPLWCLLMIGHLPAAVIVSAAIGGAVIVNARSARAPARILPAVAAALLGTAMASFYLWPALLEMDQIKIRRLTAGYFDFQRHFVRPSQWVDYRWGHAGTGIGAADQMSLQIGVGQWLCICGAIAAMALRRGRGELVWWLAAIAAAMLMMTPASRAIWQAVPFLAFIQFPWRFMIVVVVGCAAAAALALGTIPNVRVGAAIVIGATALQWYATRMYLADTAGRPRITMSIDAAEWRDTVNARRNSFSEPGYDPISAQGSPAGAVERWAMAAGSGEVRPELVNDDRVVLNVRADTAARLAIRSRYMNGWKAWIDGHESSFDVDETFGYLQIPVAAGTHRVEARFTDTPVRRSANIASVAGLSGWLALAAFSFGAAARRRRRSATSR